MITSKFCRLPVDLVYEKREAKTNQQQFDMNKQADKQTNRQRQTIGEKFLTMDNSDEVAGREAMVNYEINEEGTEGGRDGSNDCEEAAGKRRR